MADVTINYKGSEIADMSASGTKTLLTSGTFCEDDITISYAKPSIPTPSNMIANGDFSQAGATTDGWSSVNPSRSTIAVTDGKLVLTHTTTSNGNYGMSYAVNTQAGHIYYFRFKVARTIGGSDGDSAVIQIMLGTEVAYVVRGLSQNDIVESVAAYKTSSAESTLIFQFGGSIGTAAANDSMMELYYVEMYDVTDIVPN